MSEQQYHPRYLEREISKAISLAAFTTVNSVEAGYANEYAIVKALEAITAPYKKRAEKLKDIYAAKLAEPCEEFTLIKTPEVILSAKVGNPRTAFDLDLFIKEVAERYDLPASELQAMAALTLKKQKAPVTMIVTVQKDEQDD